MKILRALVAVVLATLAFVTPSIAALRVDITNGNVQPMPIAIPDFIGSGGPGQGGDIAGVVRADLERSGLFRSLDPKSFVDQIHDINTPPDFKNWRVINAQALVTGQQTTRGDGLVYADYRLWDVYGESQMLGVEVKAKPTDWRHIAHVISDAIYERVTGEKGYFNTQIVYIAETGPALTRKKMLAVMDEDGFNPRYLTRGDYLVLTPRFNPTAQMIAYMSYVIGKPRVYLFDLETGIQDMLGNFPNMTFSPRFSPDGNRIVMSQEKEGNSDIYVMDLRTRSVQRLTTDPAIDTAPSFSPDGSQIAFESDRGGSQQVYVMNADGSNQHRISFGAGRNGTPVWSPRGDLIAFTKQNGGSFRIGVMRPDGSNERMLSNGWEDEGPTWAPNGRVLMFTRTTEGGRGSQIWSVDITGRNEMRVKTSTGASDPAWSPLIPIGTGS